MNNSRNIRTQLSIVTMLSLILAGCIYDDHSCEVFEVSYSTDIIPIFDANCASCHSGTYPESGLDMTDYQQVSDSLTSINILEVVQLGLGEYQAMPPSPNSPLTDCQILKFQTWIDQGRQNN